MAISTTDMGALRPALRTRIDSFLAGLGQGFNAYVESRSRIAMIKELDAKSDEELLAMGLHRDQIPQHVFRDLFYI